MNPAPSNLTRYAWVSIGTAVLTIGLKTGAYLLTGSVGLLSDAVESLVNLAAALMTLAMLSVAQQPPDQEHPHGHDKAEYFASGFEGALIVLAAAAICWTAIPRLLAPQPLERLGLGLAISVAASCANLVAARVLLSAGKKHRSIALEADAHHLMTDVVTSAGVLIGIGLVALTGWLRVDPIVAILVAANILRTGAQLMKRSAHGLLDIAVSPEEQKALNEVLARHTSEIVKFHAVRTRQAGARRFVSMHVLVPGDWTVRRGHELVERIEHEIHEAIPRASVLTHLEAIEDPASWQDEGLERSPGPRPAPPPEPGTHTHD
ncbi:MAG: cation transporter [Deltaproteobacteria bacterium]|nr:cation transporter [Deltaproteobacteria bacterium]